jgi:very-short-patch-repair endonuclease
MVPRGRIDRDWSLTAVIGPLSDQSRAAWALAASQDDVVKREQLLALGLTENAIRHRVATGRLHRLWPEVFAVGRRRLTRKGLWRAAVFACDHPQAALSHASAAGLSGLPVDEGGVIHVSVPVDLRRRLAGIQCHRRSNLACWEIVERDGIPLTGPATTVVDIAPWLSVAELERVINEADKLELIDPEILRAELERLPRRPGKARVRRILDRRTFVLTDSELERHFVPIALRAGLGVPRTGVHLNGFKVDFFWPDLGLVVETDGLRYHRTPAQQARDRLRDQAHTAAGLTPLRFTHAQVRYEADRVERLLRTVATRLRRVIVR